MTEPDEEQLLQLDGITFSPKGDGEDAHNCTGLLVGQLWPDSELRGWWKVSKVVRGDWCAAKPARSAAEARAFICSKVRE